MANMKIITKYICSECGHITTTKTGKCPSCNSWGTFEIFEEPSQNTKSKKTFSHV
ncbi:MAG: DNA repair protein RadA, partial [Synergistaceae bacterium]|nr:DNA repair protein RadA [Synergistaceae bacterium]